MGQAHLRKLGQTDLGEKPQTRFPGEKLMRTIAIVNEKGGTAKTTTAVNLSAALGEIGQKVLLVDLDGQGASSRWVGVEDDTRLSDAIIRGKGLEPIDNVLPGVSLAPGSGKLDSIAHELRPTQGGQLRKVLLEIGDRYDYTIIDCPPSLGNRLIGNALLAATHAIVPVETSILALDGLKILLTTLEDMRDGFGHEIILAGVVASRYDGRTRLSRLVLAELKRALPEKVFDTVIRETVRLRECPASGQSILTFAPDSHAAEDYRALAREIMDTPERWEAPDEQSQVETDDAEMGRHSFAIDDLPRRTSARVCEGAHSAEAETAAIETHEDPAEREEIAASSVPEKEPHDVPDRIAHAQHHLESDDPEITDDSDQDQPDTFDDNTESDGTEEIPAWSQSVQEMAEGGRNGSSHKIPPVVVNPLQGEDQSDGTSVQERILVCSSGSDEPSGEPLSDPAEDVEQDEEKGEFPALRRYLQQMVCNVVSPKDKGVC